MGQAAGTATAMALAAGSSVAGVPVSQLHHRLRAAGAFLGDAVAVNVSP